MLELELDLIENDNVDMVEIDIDANNVDLSIKSRYNQDNSINKFGRKLLEMCITTQSRILNGRLLGHLGGELT